MNVSKMVPEVYYKESRDFSYLGRLFEVVFNYMKTASDNVVYNFDNVNINYTLMELFIKTLGFEIRHIYDTKDLVYIANSFVELMKNKGTKEAIELACQLLYTSQKIKCDSQDTYSPIIDNKNMTCTIRIPSKLNDLILLEDLLDYILPSGFVYSILKIDDSIKSSTSTSIAMNSTNKLLKNYDVGQVTQSKDDIHIENINSDTRSTIYTGTIVAELDNTENN